jgi:uncharacterized oxidoreductase
MDITTSTVFISGATSGLGLGIARRLQQAGSTVIIGGRRTELLKELSSENPGLGTVEIDVTDNASVLRARDEVLARYPDLSAVVTMSGIMRIEDLRDPERPDDARETIETNLFGTFRLVDAFLPHLLQRGSGTILTVSSGIAFVPYPLTPTYGVTKAGIHSYSESLRVQLEGTGVEVAELIPPLTGGTGLLADPDHPEMDSRENPYAMPLADFVEEAVALIGQQPTPPEITVERVKAQRTAATTGLYDQMLAGFAEHLAVLGHR